MIICLEKKCEVFWIVLWKHNILRDASIVHEQYSKWKHIIQWRTLAVIFYIEDILADVDLNHPQLINYWFIIIIIFLILIKVEN